MSELPKTLLYSKNHEWIRLEEADSEVTVGITQYAQESLGDITFVELPKVGDTLKAGEAFGVVESVKAASDLYAPLSAEVLEVNGALDASPQLVNQLPYTEGWMLRARFTDKNQLSNLLDASAYKAFLG